MMLKWKNWIKVLVFSIGVVAMLATMTWFFKVTDARIYQTVRGFYEEENDSLDAVYIGASNVYSYWQGPIAWGEYGQAVYPMSVPNMPIRATKYMIEECRKTQPNALYIINLNALKDMEFTEVEIHNTSNFLPLSNTKIKMIDDLCAQIGITGMQKMEYYFPFIRFHASWSEFDKDSFDKSLNGLKGAAEYDLFLSGSTDLSMLYRQTQQCVGLREDQYAVLDDLLCFCEMEQVKVLFVAVPQIIDDESVIAQLNQMCDIVRDRGFNVLNLQDDMEMIGMDTEADFYNERHTNVHGSLKFTRYLSEYLRDVYGFADKRGDVAYASWDAAYEKYLDIIQWHTMDFERIPQNRDFRLSMPKNVKCTAYGHTSTLTWDSVDGAQGYRIYKRYEYSDWSFVADVEADVTSYTDQNLETYATYTYTVVPISFDGDIVQYGNFCVQGYEIIIPIDPPEQVSMQESDGGITITGNPKDQAHGYYVDRKTVGQNWIRIADVGNACSYTDLYEQEGMSCHTKNDTITQKFYAPSGLLRMAELEAPGVFGEMDAEQCVLSWYEVKGASDYYVYKQYENGVWEKAAQMAAGENLSYREVSTEETGGVFEVSVVLEYGEEIYEYPSQSIIVSGGNV